MLVGPHYPAPALGDNSMELHMDNNIFVGLVVEVVHSLVDKVLVDNLVVVDDVGDVLVGHLFLRHDVHLRDVRHDVHLHDVHLHDVRHDHLFLHDDALQGS